MKRWSQMLSRSAATLGLALAACVVDVAPAGAGATPIGDGPRVVFDRTRRPLPEVPMPNDVLTFADPSSRTGRRIDLSQIAPTRFETVTRLGIGEMEGWGTFAPITVAFEGTGAEPAIDLEDVATRMRDFAPGDDPFWVVDLVTGIPVPLDVGKRSFPLAVTQPNRFWENDPRATSDTVMFETHEEGFGLARGAYSPQRDTDFDGVLDHPNVLRETGANARIDEVIDWYERETDTLILRPVVPLEEKRAYAVILTDRLRGRSGPVRSPFPFIHHALQKDGAERVRSILNDPARSAWFGDLSGSGLDHVAFVWTFTTQPVHEDLRLLRDGLHGTGPFARLADDFTPEAKTARVVGLSPDDAHAVTGEVEASPACAAVKRRPYVLNVASAKDGLRQLLGGALSLSAPELERLVASLDDVDHFVLGSFESPYFLGDPEREEPDGKFDLDWKHGTGRIRRDVVQFWLSVPKARGERKAPFPVTLWAHGTTLHAGEIVVRAGDFAKQGMAMMGINMPGHGLYLAPGLEAAASGVFRGQCLAPFVKALVAGRHRDLNGDGVPDSGGLLSSAHVFHSRDSIRQSVVDEMQATRLLRSWDGVRRTTEDYDGNGLPDLAGDFDGDGVPDVGGPDVPITSSGSSFGGVIAMVHGAVDPSVVATAAVSGGGGLLDVATRSALVPDAVLEQLLSPLVVAVPGAAVAFADGRARTRCAPDHRSVRFVVNDLNRSREIEIACLAPSELDAGRTVVVENLRSRERRCARTEADGRFRVPVPADTGDRLDIQIYDARDAVGSYGTCDTLPSAPVGRRIRSFEQSSIAPVAASDPARTCDAAYGEADLDPGAGCQQFRDHFFPVGSALVAPQEGLGLRRQTPDLRRFLHLTQAAIDPGDPINFAPYYGLRTAPGPDGKPLPPRAIAAMSTAGDPLVPTASGYAFSRASGALPFLPPSFSDSAWAGYATPRALFDALGGRTPNDVVIESHALEGVARLERTRAEATCAPNWVAGPTCPDAPAATACTSALADVDWISEGASPWQPVHPRVPLRLARAIDVLAVDTASLEAAWAPRLLGAPFAPDEAAWIGTRPLASMLDAWLEPGGQHDSVYPNPCKAFDDVLYWNNLLVRFLATRGTDLYFLGHPSSHRCLERSTCPFFSP